MIFKKTYIYKKCIILAHNDAEPIKYPKRLASGSTASVAIAVSQVSRLNLEHQRHIRTFSTGNEYFR